MIVFFSFADRGGWEPRPGNDRGARRKQRHHERCTDEENRRRSLHRVRYGCIWKWRIQGKIITFTMPWFQRNHICRFQGDGGDNAPHKPPRELTDEEASQQGKFKMSTKEKWRILKNVTAISCAFMIQFTAFQGTANLQSSINSKDGLGTLSLSSIFAALVVSCIFVPSFLIKRLTVKWTLCLSMLCYAPYIASQFYPR